jgi:hypothetical protein
MSHVPMTAEQHIAVYNSKAKHTKSLTILKNGTKGIYDVFSGDGWTNHTKIHYNKSKNKLTFVEGVHITKELIGELLCFLNK